MALGYLHFSFFLMNPLGISFWRLADFLYIFHHPVVLILYIFLVSFVSFFQPVFQVFRYCFSRIYFFLMVF